MDRFAKTLGGTSEWFKWFSSNNEYKDALGKAFAQVNPHIRSDQRIPTTSDVPRQNEDESPDVAATAKKTKTPVDRQRKKQAIDDGAESQQARQSARTSKTPVDRQRKKQGSDEVDESQPAGKSARKSHQAAAPSTSSQVLDVRPPRRTSSRATNSVYGR
jgi:hypothetical protein